MVAVTNEQGDQLYVKVPPFMTDEEIDAWAESVWEQFNALRNLKNNDVKDDSDV